MPGSVTGCSVSWLIRDGRWLYFTPKRSLPVKERAASGNLNRGLRLNLPYFNDQELRIDIRKIEVIPVGWVMFVPAFVVMAMRREQTKVSHDIRLNPSTRKHLLDLLEQIRQAFETS